MIQNIILAAVLIVAFFMCVFAYFTGLKHGKQLNNNNIPQLNINPIKTIAETIKVHKGETELEDTITDIMTASKESMLYNIKKAVR